MSNLLSGFQGKIAELVMKVDVASSLPSISTPNFEKPEAPKITSDSLTDGRKKVESKISDEANKLREDAENKAKEAVKKAKEEQKKLVEDACKNNPIRFDELQMDMAEMGVALGELTTTCAALPIRLALAPASIIGSCPLGPTVQPTQLVMTLKQMKEMGDDLGTKYNKVEASYNKLGLDKVAEVAQSNELFQSVPGASALIPVVSTVTSLISGVLGVAKVGITMVGGSISSVGGGGGRSKSMARSVSTFALEDDSNSGVSTYKLESPEEGGSEVEMEAPDISYDASPQTCFAFSPKEYYDDEGHYDKVVTNCSKFTILNKEGKAPDCNNCTKYKAYSQEVTKKVIKNEDEIFGEEGSKENPKPGSILARISNTEGRCTALESRATVLEGRATKLEDRATKLESRATVLEDRATKLENRCNILEGKMDNNVGWSIMAKLDEENNRVYIDLLNSKKEIISPDSNGHSTWFDYTKITSDTYIEDVNRIDIYTYSKLDEDLKLEAQYIINNYIGTPASTGWIIPNSESIWGVNHVTNKIDYSVDEIPYESRSYGTSCMVFTFKNTIGEKIVPVWINATLFGTYYNFTTKVATEDTKSYFKLGFEAVNEGFAKSIIATYKYSPEGDLS